MRLVLSGYYGFDNAGDEAVLAGLLASLRRVEPGIEVTVLSGDPAATERVHGVAAVPRARPGPLRAALLGADGLISGGGSLLQDRTSPRPVAYYAGIMLAARLLGRPYAVHAQGLGPIGRAPNRWLAAAALRGAARVSLRDEGSVDLARRLGVRRPIEVVPDPALALRPPTTTEGPETRPIVVALRDSGMSRRHLDGIRDGLRSVADGRRIVALPMQDPADRETSELVVTGLAGAEVVRPGATLDERLATIGGGALVVGMRVHALILAAAAHVPAIGISYDPKVDAFAAQAGQAVVGVAGAPVDPEAFAAAARAALSQDRAPYIERVERLRAGLVPSTRATLEALRAA